jgi:hypothetical protein
MSKIEVNKIGPQCGTTLTVGCGAGQTVVADAATVTLGRCGGTVALASGASQSGFGRTGTVDWQTGSIKTATFTAANGEGYFADTSSSAFTMNLPAGSAGAIVSVADYAGTWQTNNLTVSPNGTDKIGSANVDVVLNTEGQSVTFVYVDGTQGWINTMDSTSNVRGNPNLVATGGTITTCGNFKIHTFTGPGTFTVTNLSATAAENTVGYTVVAGGGGAILGGGGAGGFREGRNVPVDNFTASPLVANAPTNAVTVTATAFPITVGGGGASNGKNPGSNSVFSTITSTGGGGGADFQAQGGAGGSGGGGGRDVSPTSVGNSPPVSPPQGNNGGGGVSSGPNTDYTGGGGGGGAGGVGTNGTGNSNVCGENGGPGGNGVANSITGSSVTRAGGGGGTTQGPPCGANPGGSGGSGGGGNGGRGTSQPNSNGTPGTANTGGGAGGGSPGSSGGAGGSGIVIIRYKFQ